MALFYNLLIIMTIINANPEYVGGTIVQIVHMDGRNFINHGVKYAACWMVRV
ncbi:hypothetical protein HCH_00341 [Hahella chejuensis KCTC 2396]|uniref:Uncharacterized protein n=1 Tax=Hahella chejuensis (strain KCTC 2396) TaxID=349521 RepID=Q2SQ21_HAHCH|nr:hypothetical protein HCH_00341 [Hahella chejuensis KCTC 2396]